MYGQLGVSSMKSTLWQAKVDKNGVFSNIIITNSTQFVQKSYVLREYDDYNKIRR